MTEPRIERIAAFVLAVSVAAVMLGGCGRDEATSSETPPEVSVSVTKPEDRELPRSIHVTGTLYGEEETTIAAKVAGRIVEVVKDLGDVARPGDPLVRVDPTDYELARAERQNAFLEALARLGLDKLPPEGFDVDKLPSVERAQLQAENAKARRDRAKVLADRKPPLISEQDYADIATAYEVAQSNLKVEHLTAEATLAQARTLDAQLKMADQLVTDTIHRAPETISTPEAAGGVTEPAAPADHVYEVAARMVSVGDYVQIGAPLLRLVDADPLKLRVPVTERRLGTVQKGQQVDVKIDAFAETFTGEVARVSPAVDTATRTFPVEIHVPNAESKLKPGSFATAHIEIGKEHALVVPRSSVITFAGSSKVVLVRDGKIAEQAVELGDVFGDLIEVRAGVTKDDVLVTNPSAGLTTGTAVTVSSAAATPAKASAP